MFCSINLQNEGKTYGIIYDVEHNFVHLLSTLIGPTTNGYGKSIKNRLTEKSTKFHCSASLIKPEIVFKAFP